MALYSGMSFLSPLDTDSAIAISKYMKIPFRDTEDGIFSTGAVTRIK